MTDAIERPARIRPRIADLAPSLIGEVAAAGFGDPEVIPLWFGEGDLVTPAPIRWEAVAALAAGETFYTSVLGISPLRAALSAYETERHRRPVGFDRVVVTSSGMQAIMLSLQAILDPGEGVVVLSPVWPNFIGALEILGGIPQPVALAGDARAGWSLDIDRVAAAIDRRTRAIFVNSPSNPTGWVASAADWQALLDLARRHGLWLIADEVYSRLVYEGDQAPSILDLAEPEDRVMVVNSFSKNWAMTGWRLGWLVVPTDLTRALVNLIQYNVSGAPPFLQHAARLAVAEGEGIIAEVRRRAAAGRARLIERLAPLPRVRWAAPPGAFYAFFAVEGMTDSLAAARQILAETRVGLAPGAAFGLGGEGHLRLCYAASLDRLDQALDRLVPCFGQR